MVCERKMQFVAFDALSETKYSPAIVVLHFFVFYATGDGVRIIISTPLLFILFLHLQGSFYYTCEDNTILIAPKPPRNRGSCVHLFHPLTARHHSSTAFDSGSAVSMRLLCFNR